MATSGRRASTAASGLTGRSPVAARAHEAAAEAPQRCPILSLRSGAPQIHALEYTDESAASIQALSAPLLGGDDAAQHALWEKPLALHAVKDISGATCSWAAWVPVRASTLAHDPEFTAFLCDTAAAEGVEASQITVRLVGDWVADRDVGQLLEALECLRAVGVSLAASPFSSSDTHLRVALVARPTYIEVPVESALASADVSYRTALLDSFRALALRIGAEVVALGVNSKAELDSMLGLGIRLFKCPFTHLDRLAIGAI